MKELFYLLLCTYLVLGEETLCGPGFRRTAFNAHHRQDFNVTSHGRDITDLLHRRDLTAWHSLSFSIKANGRRQGPLGPMSRGFRTDELCFWSKCAKHLDMTFVGRTPDPQPTLVNGQVMGWSGTGGGLAGARHQIRHERRLTRQCVPGGGLVERIDFRLRSSGLVRARCGQIVVRDLHLTGCIDESVEETNSTPRQGVSSVQSQ